MFEMAALSTEVFVFATLHIHSYRQEHTKKSWGKNSRWHILFDITNMLEIAVGYCCWTSYRRARGTSWVQDFEVMSLHNVTVVRNILIRDFSTSQYATYVRRINRLNAQSAHSHIKNSNTDTKDYYKFWWNEVCTEWQFLKLPWISKQSWKFFRK